MVVNIRYPDAYIESSTQRLPSFFTAAVATRCSPRSTDKQRARRRISSAPSLQIPSSRSRMRVLQHPHRRPRHLKCETRTTVPSPLKYVQALRQSRFSYRGLILQSSSYPHRFWFRREQRPGVTMLHRMMAAGRDLPLRQTPHLPRIRKFTGEAIGRQDIPRLQGWLRCNFLRSREHREISIYFLLT